MEVNKRNEPQVEHITAEGGVYKKILSPSKYLTFEHSVNMALSVIIPGIILVAFWTAIGIWSESTGFFGVLSGLFDGYYSSMLIYLEVMASLMLVAVLVVLTPLMFILSRRVRARILKERQYISTMKFKVPVYVALGVSAVIIICSLVQIVYVILSTFALIGVTNAQIGDMYLVTFLPAGLTVIIYATVSTYLHRLVRGRSSGRKFCMGVSLISVAIILSLFITAVVKMHDDSINLDSSDDSSNDLENYYDDYYNDYNNSLDEYYNNYYDSYY